MPPACSRPNHLARRRYLETLGYRLARPNSFGSSHKNLSLSKRAGNIGTVTPGIKREFCLNEIRFPMARPKSGQDPSNHARRRQSEEA
jgi:hypothetical protein